MPLVACDALVPDSRAARAARRARGACVALAIGCTTLLVACTTLSEIDPAARPKKPVRVSLADFAHPDDPRAARKPSGFYDAVGAEVEPLGEAEAEGVGSPDDSETPGLFDTEWESGLAREDGAPNAPPDAAMGEGAGSAPQTESPQTPTSRDAPRDGSPANAAATASGARQGGVTPNAAPGAQGPSPAGANRNASGRASGPTSTTPGAGPTARGNAPGESTNPAAAADATGAHSGRTVRVGEKWLVEGLLGQINGRPVFADEFLAPLESRILDFALNEDRVAARNNIARLVHERFQEFINSELIISEAESQLTGEQQQGLLAWLRNLQEEEIAGRGGNRFAAEQSLTEESDLTIEEFMEQRRQYALASSLLAKKVKPRTIVSWKDVEREYRRRLKEFVPPPVMRLGRIALDESGQATLVAQVKERIANGASFEEIVELTETKDGGLWVQAEIASATDLDAEIDRLDLTKEIKSKLHGLPIGKPSEPMSSRGKIVWLAILGVDTPPGRSVFDPEVQLLLRTELENRRGAVEQSRYISTLRSRWVSDDINEIEDRLLQVALNRYWSPG